MISQLNRLEVADQPGMERGLSPSAYDVIPEGQKYRLFVPPESSITEFSVKAIISGIVFGILFGAANTYLGLRVGLTIALFRALKTIGIGSTILEANTSQTVGSASSSLASGVLFTIPALFLWGFSPSLLQLTLLAMCGGLLGVLFMVPLRRFLITGEHGRLPYPEGTACAEVLVAAESGGAKAKNVFLGLGVGALIKFVFGFLHMLPDKLTVKLPLLKKGEVGAEVSAALLGVGFYPRAKDRSGDG